jgi:RNase P/RNase MRP subunit p29
MLSPVSKELKDVVVTGKKPMFDQKIDRLVVNVKGSITNAGSTVLEVLEKSPGVTVNRSSGTISMNGKNGVQVMINGKMNYMPADRRIANAEWHECIYRGKKSN